MKQREPYEAMAKTDKQRYEDEKASYNVSTKSPLLPLLPARKLTNILSRPMMRRKRRSSHLSPNVENTVTSASPSIDKLFTGLAPNASSFSYMLTGIG